MSPNYLVVFCIKSLMFDLKNYIQIPHKLSCVCVCLSFIHALPTRVERPRSTQTQGPRRSAATRSVQNGCKRGQESRQDMLITPVFPSTHCDCFCAPSKAEEEKGKRMRPGRIRGGPSQTRKGLCCLSNQSHLVRIQWGAASEHVNNAADLWGAKPRSYQESCLQADVRPESVFLGWSVVQGWEHPRSPRRRQGPEGPKTLCIAPSLTLGFYRLWTGLQEETELPAAPPTPTRQVDSCGLALLGVLTQCSSTN